MSISAITARGHMRFMIFEEGSVNADAFIEFLKRLMVGALFLPPYSPDRNPNELVWKHVKADTVGRMVITSKDDFINKVRSSLLSKTPG
jgi:transposase